MSTGIIPFQGGNIGPVNPSAGGSLGPLQYFPNEVRDVRGRVVPSTPPPVPRQGGNLLMRGGTTAARGLGFLGKRILYPAFLGLETQNAYHTQRLLLVSLTMERKE